MEDIAGHAASRLLEQIVDTPPREAVARLAEFVSARLASRTLASRTTARFDLPHRATSVFELAQALRTSRRSVYNRLTDSVGLAPKRALRIHRLHTALMALNQGRSLADAAATAAYSDQAHFSREAAQLLGEPPGAWRRRRHCSFVQDTNRSR